MEPGSTASQTSFKGLQWRWGGTLIEIPVYLRLFNGKELVSFISVPEAAAFEHILTAG